MSNKPLILYHCPKCPRGFYKKAECEKHMKIHEDEINLVRIHLSLEDGQWKYYRGLQQVVPSTQAIDTLEITEFYLQWNTMAKDTSTSIAEAKKRLKIYATKRLLKHIEAIAKLDTGDKQ